MTAPFDRLRAQPFDKLRGALAADPRPRTLGFDRTPRGERAAAVLMLFTRDADPSLTFVTRAETLRNHAGQVALPGGAVDPGDIDATDTALREAEEEVGLAPEFVEVLGALPTYVPGSSFLITPVVALVRPDCVLRPNPYEVADLFEVPLDFLLNPANHRHHAFEANGVVRNWLSMPYMDRGPQRFVWGATAGMIRNLYRFLAASGAQPA